MKYILLLFLLSGCSGYRLVKSDTCERINGVVYCEDVMIDTNYYPSCSIYDDKTCRGR